MTTFVKFTKIWFLKTVRNINYDITGADYFVAVLQMKSYFVLFILIIFFYSIIGRVINETLILLIEQRFGVLVLTPSSGVLICNLSWLHFHFTSLYFNPLHFHVASLSLHIYFTLISLFTHHSYSTLTPLHFHPNLTWLQIHFHFVTVCYW